MTDLSLFEYLFMVKGYSEIELEWLDFCLANDYYICEAVKKDINDYFEFKYGKGA